MSNLSGKWVRVPNVAGLKVMRSLELGRSFIRYENMMWEMEDKELARFAIMSASRMGRVGAEHLLYLISMTDKSAAKTWAFQVTEAEGAAPPDPSDPRWVSLAAFREMPLHLLHLQVRRTGEATLIWDLSLGPNGTLFEIHDSDLLTYQERILLPISDSVNELLHMLRARPGMFDRLKTLNPETVSASNASTPNEEPNMNSNNTGSVLPNGPQKKRKSAKEQGGLLASAALQGVAMGGVNQASEIFLDIAKMAAEAVPGLAPLLETPLGREVAKVIVAGLVHTAACELPSIPGNEGVAKAARLQLTYSVANVSSSEVFAKVLPLLAKLSAIGDKLPDVAGALPVERDEVEVEDAELEVQVR